MPEGTLRSTLTALGLVGLVGVVLWELVARLGRVHPLFELASNLRPHQLTAAVVVLGVLIVARRRLAVVAALVVAVGVAQLAPYWLARPDTPIVGGTEFAVMQFNIAATNPNVDGIARQIDEANPDVVVITELTSDQWNALVARLPDYPSTVAEPWDDQAANLGGGMAILSKHDITPVSFPASVSPPHRPVLAATVAAVDGEVLVVGMHPHASRTTASKVDLRRDQFAAVAERLSSYDGPAVVAGDLNVAPTSTQYRDFLSDLSWRDPHKTVGWNATWWFRGMPLGLPVDHVLVSDEIALLGYDSRDGAGSDHKAVVARLSLPSSRS